MFGKKKKQRLREQEEALAAVQAIDAEKQKKEQELQDRRSVRKAITDMNKFLFNLETKKRSLIETAQKAKQANIESQYALAKSGLKMTVSQIKTIRTILLNIEITSQTNEVMAMSNEFVNSMGILTKQMKCLNQVSNFGELEAEFQEAIFDTANQNQRMSEFLQKTESLFNEVSAITEHSHEGLDDEVNSLLEIKCDQPTSNDNVEKSPSKSNNVSSVLADIKKLKEMI